MWDPALVVARDASRVGRGCIWLCFYAFKTLVVALLGLCIVVDVGFGFGHEFICLPLFVGLLNPLSCFVFET